MLPRVTHAFFSTSPTLLLSSTCARERESVLNYSSLCAVLARVVRRVERKNQLCLPGNFWENGRERVALFFVCLKVEARKNAAQVCPKSVLLKSRERERAFKAPANCPLLPSPPSSSTRKGGWNSHFIVFNDPCTIIKRFLQPTTTTYITAFALLAINPPRVRWRKGRDLCSIRVPKNPHRHQISKECKKTSTFFGTK